MFHVEQSTDYDRIGKLITHPDIQKELLTAPYDSSKLNRDDVIYYVMSYCNNDVGICVILSSDNYHFVDTGFVSEIRGNIAKRLGLMAKDMFFDAYPYQKVYAMIAKRHKASLCYAKWMGFKVIFEDALNYLLEGSKNGRSS